MPGLAARLSIVASGTDLWGGSCGRVVVSALGVMRPVIVVGGGTSGLAVIRSLGAAGVPVVLLSYDDRDIARVSKWVTQVVRSPHPEDDERKFLLLVSELAGCYRGALVMPATDASLAVLARSHRVLAAWGFVVAAPPEKVARVCLNTAETYAAARASGVPVPVTVAVSDLADIARYAGQASFPAVLKPTFGDRFQESFGRKWTWVGDPDHAAREFRRAAGAGLEVVIQEFVPGDESCGVNYNAYFCNGKPLVELTSVTIRTSPVESGSPSVVVSHEVPQAMVVGRTMLAELGFDGFANIEFKRDARDGVYKLIRVNPRHNHFAALAQRCGINFPWLHYCHLIDGWRPVYQDYGKGVHWIDPARDVSQSLSYLCRRGDSPGRFLRPYRAPHVFAVWSGDDTGPGWAHAADILNWLGRPCRVPARGGIPGSSAVAR